MGCCSFNQDGISGGATWGTLMAARGFYMQKHAVGERIVREKIK
jgi:hypothetical protein